MKITRDSRKVWGLKEQPMEPGCLEPDPSTSTSFRSDSTSGSHGDKDGRYPPQDAGVTSK